MIWVPVNSGLTVEVLNIADKTRHAAPIEVQAGVDPAKGRSHVKIPFGRLTGNEGKGPSIDIGLCWTSDTGWDLYGFSFMMVGEPVMNKSAVLLASPNGNFECFEPDQLKGTLTFQDFKLVGRDDPLAWINSWRVVHKGGVEEYLQPSAVVKKSWFNARAILPESIIDATGNSMKLSWKTLEDNDMTKPTLNLLESISCGETTVFKSEVVGNKLNCILYPGQTGQVAFQIEVDTHVDDEFTMKDSMEEEQFWQMMRMYSATFPFGRVLGIKRTSAAGVASLDLKYTGDSTKGSARVKSLQSAISSDVFEYDGYEVSVYTRKTAGAPDILRQYAYDDRKTTVTTKIGGHLCTSELHFSDNDAITRHIETQGACSTTTAYSRTEDKSTRLLSLETSVTLKKGADSRMEKALTVLDADGNLIKTVEKGITTEWTYYDGAAKLTTLPPKTQRVSRISSVAHGVGVVFDYANPIGWLLNIFGSQGLTWGTEEVRTVTASPNDIKHDKKVFNLPVGLECPGDRNYFTVHVESEKVYSGTGNSRVDLSWTFYGYTLLPTRGGCNNAIKPSTKFTALYPETAFDQKLNTFKAASMSLERISYVTDIKNKDFGRVLTEESVRLNSDCKELDISRHQTSYSYAFSKQVLTTRMAEKFNLTLEVSSAFARDIVSGLQTSATDRQKKQTTRTYDDHGRLTCEVDNAQDSKARQASNFQYHRTRTGHCVTVFLPQGDKRREEYDLNGNQTKLWTCGAGFVGWRLLTRTVFDEMGRASIRTDYDYLPDGTLLSRQEQRLHYDDWGRLHYTDLPDGSQAYCEHDPIKRQTLEFLKADRKIRQKVLSTFDERGNLTRREMQDSAGKAQGWAEYTYDAGSRLIKSKTDQGAESSFTYDPRGRMCTITEGKTFISNEYPVHSPLASVVKAGENENTAVELGSRTMNALSCVTRTTVGGRKVSYKYDGASPLGTRTTETPALGEAFARHSVDHRFSRDPRSGAVVEQHVVKDEQSSVTHVYSLRGALLSFTNAFGQKTDYHYDACGRRIKALSNETHNTLSYDAFGTLTEETVWRIAEYSSVKISYSHDALGQETARSFVIDDKHKLNLKYTYEKGRIKTAQLLNDSTSLSKEDYAYDDQGRLKTWTCDGTQRATDPWLNETLKKQSFTYDLLGNIQTCISETTGSKKANTATYAYSDTDKMQPIGISHSEKSCTAVELSYDAEGRLTRNPVNKLDLHYDKDGRQVGSGAKHLAHYDSFGRRVRNEDSYYAECFYYNGNVPYARQGAVRIGDKKTCDQRRTLLLNESGGCVAQQQTLSGGGELEINTFELKDIRGSVIASWRKGKEGFTYLPFTPYGYRPSREDDLHWLGFTGQPLDRQSGGVYHLGNGCRSYDPITLVFHAPDNPGFSPFGKSGVNWYAYCSGDPVNMVDPSGQSHSRIVSQEVVTTHSPFLDDPVINQVFTAACMIALAPVTGGGSISLGATVGITVVSTGFGVASTLTEEDDSDLSNALSWTGFAIGLFGQIQGLNRGNVPGVSAAGTGAVRTVRNAVANQRLANRGIEHLRAYALYSGNEAFRVSVYLPLAPARRIATLTRLVRASGHETRLYKDLWGAGGGKLFEQSWADADVLDTYNKAVFRIPGEAASYVRAAHIMNVDSWYLNQQTYKVRNLEGEYCQGLRWSVIPRALRPEG
ncbi:MAG: RHS repeat-associated core domain-containing protein [Pseudomonas sp.]|uniref:RHS repeat-associated core domain-containing protein n=1 Tax=Pseudomonas sp. TaxID=306 RepID=UPI003D14384F